MHRSKKSGSRSKPKGRSKGRFSLPKGTRLVPGIHAAREALNVRPNQVSEVWLQEGWASNASLVEIAGLAKRARVAVKDRSRSQLDEIIPSHQGVCVVANGSPQFNWADLGEAETEQVLILDGLEDPHNLGAIIRTAWLMGVKAIFVPEMRAVGLAPSAIKVASGGAEHVPVESVANLPQLLEQLKKHGFWIFALAYEPEAQSIWSQNFPEKVALIIGSEGKGVRRSLLKSSDETIYIPQVDTAASYNASVAAAMALAEVSRQQKKC